MEQQTETPRNGAATASLPRTIWLIVGLGAGLWMLFLVRQALVVIFIAFLVATTLYPGVRWMEHRQLPRGLSIATFYLVFVIFVVVMITLMSKLIVTEGTAFLNAFPTYIQRTTEFLERIPWLRSADIASVFANLTTTLTNALQEVMRSVVAYLGVAFRTIMTGLTILVLVFLMVMQARSIESALLLLVPYKQRDEMSGFFRRICERTGLYIRGQLIVATVLGLIIYVGLVILNVPYAPLLALLAFVLDLIPIIGSLSASVLGIIVAFGQDPMLAVWTAALYLVANQLEIHIFSPYIMGRTVGLGTFWVLVSILCGAVLYGVAGLFLAIPIAILTKLILMEYVVPKFGPPPEAEVVAPPEGGSAPDFGST